MEMTAEEAYERDERVLSTGKTVCNHPSCPPIGCVSIDPDIPPHLLAQQVRSLAHNSAPYPISYDETDSA